MKSTTVSFVLGATLALGASLPQHAVRDVPKLTKDSVPGLKVLPPPLYSGLFDKNGKLQAVTSNGNYTAPKSQVPDIQPEKPKRFTDAQRKKIRYGPFRLPGTKELNWQSKSMGLSGMADEYIPNLTKPCNECILAGLNADLEYANGSVTGGSAWLHHSVIVAAGPKVRDPICDESNTETIFSSGNERSFTSYSDVSGEVKAGYRIRSEDTFTLVGEFKNELETEQWVWLTIGYEYYDGANPTWKDSHVVWLNVGSSLNCNPKAANPFGPSNLTSKGVPKSKVFSEASMPWKSPINATILGVGGHLHDGGTSIDFYQNKQKICEAKASYANGVSGGMSHGAGEHIKSMTSCHLMTEAHAGDSFYLVANYDLTKHKGSQMDDGSLDEVMGVGTVLLITEPKL